MKKIAQYLPHVARVLMGLLFVMTGSNGFFHYLPMPNDMPEGAMALSMAFVKSGYFMQLVMGTQLLVGLLLVVNRFVPLALALIAPVVVNIFAFHVFLAPAGIGMALFVAALEVYLAWSYRKVFTPMLSAKNAL